MQSFLPLLRSIAGAVPPSTSKIPHLRKHLALRRAGSQTSKKNGRPLLPTQQQRHIITSASVPYFDFPPDNVRSDEETEQAQKVRSTVSDEEINRNAAGAAEKNTTIARDTNMYDLLENGNPDQILSGLISQRIGSPFINSATNEMFNRALCALDPYYFVGQFKDITRHYKGQNFSALPESSNIDGRLWRFATYLDDIVYLRRASGEKLDQKACTHLLHWAATMGDRQLADSVMNSIMPADRVKPNLESYNHYLRALVWSHAFSTAEDYKLRVTKTHLALRATKNPPRSLSGHRTASSLRGVRGIKEQVLKAFQECVDQGYTADENMFNTIMLAMSREGDIDGVKSILRSVWNIDVELLETFDEEEVESPTFYDTGNSLRPSEDLLFTVAHIFGSNNDMRTAWLLVDFISRNYDIRITERVWMHLCEWAFVLSLRNAGTGKISRETLTGLIATMIDEPHNIKPNAFVYYLLARKSWDLKRLKDMLDNLTQLRGVVEQHCEIMKELQAEVLGYVQAANTTNAFDTEDFYGLQRRFVLNYLDFERSSQLLTAGVRKLLTQTAWFGSRSRTRWTRRKMWDVLDQFRSHLPEKVSYRTETGQIELLTKYKQQGEFFHQYKLDHRTLPQMLKALDHELQSRLHPNMQALLATISSANQVCLNCNETNHSHQDCRRDDGSEQFLDYRRENGRVNITPEDDMIIYSPLSVNHRLEEA